MAYLNLDPEYFQHEKTKRLEFALGPMASIYPLRLWALAAKSCPESGVFRGLEPNELEHLIGWSGEHGVCFASLERIGFIDRDGNDIIIHKFVEHQGHLKAFHERAIKANKKRWDEIRGKSKESLTAPTRTLQGPDKDEPRSNEGSLTAPPYLTLPNQTNPINTDKCVIKRKRTTDDPLFDCFWKAYPRKIDKAHAKKEWDKMGVDQALLAVILSAITAQSVPGGPLAKEIEFILYPARWLSRRRFEDEAPPASSASSIQSDPNYAGSRIEQ